MTDIRFSRLGRHMTVEVANGPRMSIEQALREGIVTLERETARLMPDGNRHDMHFVVLGRRPIGGHFIEYISAVDAVRLSAETGAEIVGRKLRYDELPHAQPDGFEISLSHFNSLPIIDHDVKRVPADGFWARRFGHSESIFISHDGEWIEREVWFPEEAQAA